MCPEPHAGPPGASPQGASPTTQRADARHPLAHPQERHCEEYVRLPADKDAELVLLRGVIEEGESRGWKLLSAVKEPGGEALLVTWDTSGSVSG